MDVDASKNIHVSVCVPIYNVERYIYQCVCSLMEQTLSGLELIFVDDASPDRSMAILEEALRQYHRTDVVVKIIRHDCNKGVSLARKTAMDAVTGQYFIHCDPDDYVAPDMYEKLYRTAVASQADMVYCDMWYASQDGTPNGEDHFPDVLDPDDHIRAFWGKNFRASLWNRLYRSDITDDVIYLENAPYCRPAHECPVVAEVSQNCSSAGIFVLLQSKSERVGPQEQRQALCQFVQYSSAAGKDPSSGAIRQTAAGIQAENDVGRSPQK